MKDTRLAPAHSGVLATSALHRSCACSDTRPSLRVLVIPGLGGSGPTHWQSWLQRQYARSVRVEQPAWNTPDLDAWADRIASVVSRHPRTHWVAAAHSFGVLALAHHLQQQQRLGQVPAIRAALLVAPADPVKFGVSERLSQAPALNLPSLVVGSTSDPRMSESAAQRWAHLWGAAYTSLGNAGHVNVDSGHGPWLLGRYHVDQLIRDQHRRRRIEREAELAAAPLN